MANKSWFLSTWLLLLLQVTVCGCLDNRVGVAAHVTRHHGRNCRINASPQGDAQETYCRQSSAGQSAFNNIVAACLYQSINQLISIL